MTLESNRGNTNPETVPPKQETHAARRHRQLLFKLTAGTGQVPAAGCERRSTNAGRNDTQEIRPPKRGTGRAGPEFWEETPKEGYDPQRCDVAGLTRRITLTDVPIWANSHPVGRRSRPGSLDGS